MISIVSSEKLFFNVNEVSSQTKDYKTMTIPRQSRSHHVSSFLHLFLGANITRV